MKLESLFPKTKTLAGRACSPTMVKTNKKEKKLFSQGLFNIKYPDILPQQEKDYQVITNEKDLLQYLERCKETGYFSFDWETAPSDDERERWVSVKKDYEAKIAANQEDVEMVKQLEKQYEEELNYHKLSPLDPWRGKICTVSFSAAPNEARVLFLDHTKGEKNYKPDLLRNEAREEVLDILDRVIFSNREIIKIAYNLIFETKYLLKYGKYILTPVADPMVMIIRCQQLINPDAIKNVSRPAMGKSLKAETKKRFCVKMGNFLQLLEDNDVMFFDEMNTDNPETILYSAEDSDYALQHYLYWAEVAKQIPNENKENKENKLYQTYYDWLHGIEMPFMRVIGQMEYWGMKWNEELAMEKREEAEKVQKEAQDFIKKIAKDNFGMEVTPGKSGKTGDIKELMFSKMKLPVAKKTDKGNVSMDAFALDDTIFMLENNLIDLKEEEYLGEDLPEGWENNLDALSFTKRKLADIQLRKPHPYKEEGIELLKTLQNIQTYSTLYSSHIIGREKYLNEVSGRIHAGYTVWTATSRLNSFRPNQQNVPKGFNDRFGIRNLYQAEEGYILVFIDYSGFELRIMAWKSGDETMIHAFRNKGDLHRKTASTLTGKPEDEITDEERTLAKPGNFSISYGGTEHAIQRSFRDYGLRKSLPECKEVYDAVVNTYPKIPEYQKSIVTYARDHGYVETIYGYKRLLKDINSTHKFIRQSDERRASNTPIQGCLHGSTRVCIKELGFVKLEDVPKGKEFWFWDGNCYTKGMLVYSGMKEEVIIKMKNGQKIICSPEHKFLTVGTSGNLVFKTIKEFNKVEKIKLSGEAENFSVKELEFPEVKTGKESHNYNDISFAQIKDRLVLGKLLGRLCSDGHIQKNKSVRWIIAEHELSVKEFIKRNLPFKYSESIKVRKNRNQDVYYIDVHSTALAREMEKMGCYEGMPSIVWQDKEILRGFLSGYVDGDGGVSDKTVRIAFGRGKKKYKYAQDMQRAFSIFGIQTRLHAYFYRTNLCIRRRDLELFLNKIGFINPLKQEKAISKIKPKYVQPNLQGKVETVYRIVKTGKKVAMYDIVNTGTGQFVANGFITHNSASDIMKKSQNAVYEKIATEKWFNKVRQIAQIHDELILEIKASPALVKEVVAWAKKEMEKEPLANFPVPIEVDTEVGYKWGSKMSLEEWLNI